MSSLYRTTPRRMTAAVALVVALAAAIYAFSPAGLLTADSNPVSKAAPSHGVNQANALSEAFRYSADQVIQAVVSIKNETQAKVVKREFRTPRGNQPKVPNLPKEFGDLDPLLKRFFEQIPDSDSFDFDGPQTPGRQSSGSGVIIDAAGVILTNNHVVAGDGK